MANFDIFEMFPDGSYVWRVSVSGRYEKERKLQELAETSDNKFYAINLAAGETLPGDVVKSSPMFENKNTKNRAQPHNTSDSG